MVIGLYGGYVHSRHRQEDRHFEVIADNVIDAAGTQHRFASARNGQEASAAMVMVMPGCDGCNARQFRPPRPRWTVARRHSF